MVREAYPGSTSSVNDKNELVFNTPQWLLDKLHEAQKECPEFSPSQEFRNISNAKARDEDPMTAVYGVSGEEAARYARPQATSNNTEAWAPASGASSPPESPHESTWATRWATRGNTMFPIANTVEVPHDTLNEAVENGVNITYTMKSPPDWYIDMLIGAINRALKHPDRECIQAMRSMEAFRDCIRRCETSAMDKPGPQREKLFDELRDHVHKAEIMLKGINKYIVRKNRMLGMENGLPCIFMAEKVDYPWDLQADAWQLYLRWYDQDFTPDLLRGIITRKGKNRIADSIDPEWRRNHSLGGNANYHGQGNLVLGQWWPTQLCAVRDRAHGAPQGGIWGAKGEGAYSIVLSAGGYQDRDLGDEIWYSGTEAKTNEPTGNTQRLIESCEYFPDRPVRVLRSMQLSQRNPFRPNVGIRYDGLYKVVGMERIEDGREDYLFKLVRCENQHPIRWQANAARRPTKYEEAEFKRLRENGR